MLKVAGGGGAAVGAVVYQGTWDASTNTPTLTSSVGTKGNYYVVSVAGNTNLNGITDWVAGDWAIFNGSVWEKVDNTEAVISVNGQTGVVTLDYADVGAPSTTGANASGSWAISVTGSAASATNVNVDVEVANTSMFPVLVSGIGITRPKIDGGNNLRYNPGTDTLTIPNISGTNVSVGNVSATTNVVANVVAANVSLSFAGMTMPTADGSLGQFLTTNGAGTLSWVNVTTSDVTGLGTIAAQDADNVTITGGYINVASVEGANVIVTSNLYANLATANTAAMPDPSLPLNPEGYVEIVVNGTTKKIPYYGV